MLWSRRVARGGRVVWPTGVALSKGRKMGILILKKILILILNPEPNKRRCTKYL
jgi:hypothetical protein